ncbi:MAG: hypothetical protein ATN35_02460 [Epulopiscium sp. Nele67-Bin004]|nr:MAG: hypothetical protein ATN35_02460 [Epulopiscium sp. Nele67-Bin004]
MSNYKGYIDIFEINSNDVLQIVGWCICDTAVNYRLNLDNKEFISIVPQSMSRKDVQQALELDREDIGIKVEYTENWDKYNTISFEVEVQNTWNTLDTRNISDIKTIAESVTIISNIDSIHMAETKVVVKGWAFSSNGDQVEVSTKENTEISRGQRGDVKLAYKNLLEHADVGFEINCDPKQDKLNITFVAGDIQKEETISVKSWLKRNKNADRKNLMGSINLGTVKKVIQYVQKHGVQKTYAKINSKLGNVSTYATWLDRHLPSLEELEVQRQTTFDYTPQISIVVPTFNTPKGFLIEMIESVRNQTYSNWQLCIADGASVTPDTISVLKSYIEKDPRIYVDFLSENYGISGNTNKCLELATGDFVGLFDHDDLLTPNALFEVVKAINENPEVDFIYSDEDKTDEKTKVFFDAHFKPDFSPDLLRSQNYICHFTVFRRALLDKVGVFNKEYDGSQDHDLILRLTEQTEKIVHIPKILYHWRVHSASTAGGIGAKEYTVVAGIKAVQDHIDRIGLEGDVSKGQFPGTYRVEYKIIDEPRVSIIIPNKDHKEDLELCIKTVIEKSTYTNYEIIVVENNSETQEIWDYYKEIEKYDNIKVLRWEHGFNYSAINNFGAKEATGEYYILLNNDIEMITPSWIEEMLMYCQRDDVGIVGAKLYFEDDTIQHAGVIMGLGGVAGHSHKYYHRNDVGYFHRLSVVQNLSGVTAACLMIKKSIYEEVDGLDEKFQVAFNDVDLCMKVREKGYLVVFSPYVEAYHYESKSRGAEDNPEKIARFNGEISRFHDKWGVTLSDPYYSINLTLDREDFSLNNN